MKKTFAAIFVCVILLCCSACGAVRSQIEWVDFVKLGGVSYEMCDVIVPDEFVGEMLGEVTGNVPSEITGKTYNVQDGEAAFLAVGTKLFAINGHNSAEYIAAKSEDSYILYKAHDSAAIDFIDESDVSDVSDISDVSNVSGTEKQTTSAPDIKNGDVKFSAQRIKTDSIFRDKDTAVLINSAAQLKKYCSDNKVTLEKINHSADGTKTYGNNYFDTGSLIIATVTENSGSITHEVTSVKGSEKTLTVYVTATSYETMTCDMAMWHIIVEVPAGYSSAKLVKSGKFASEISTVPATSFARGEDGREETVPDIALEYVEPQEQTSPPNLSIQTTDGKTVSVAYASMSGTYTWTFPDKNGKNNTICSDGLRPCDDKKILKIKYDYCGGKAELIFNGAVKNSIVERYNVGHVTDKGEKVTVSDKNTITLLKGSYYEISVTYAQGEAVYGFICE